MKFSIVIPAYNASASLARALTSVEACAQGCEFEAIVVDDGSEDDTQGLVREFMLTRPWLRLIPAGRSGGPGHARNLGVEAACGEWVLFLDADDELVQPGLSGLVEFDDADIVAFDWIMSSPGETGLSPPQREDLSWLARMGRRERLAAFLRNRIDPSVIFHAFRREFLVDHGLRFRGGYHEDVDFMYAALDVARSIRVLEHPLYLKWNTPGSIVNTLGVRHIDGYFRALAEIVARIYSTGMTSELAADHRIGIINVGASRLVRLFRPEIQLLDPLDDILAALYEHVNTLLPQEDWEALASVPYKRFVSKYEIMLAEFMRAYRSELPTAVLLNRLGALESHSWSCYDLHFSVFLGPDEIRTCCKRYFVAGKQKGDVVILRADGDGSFTFTYQDIVAAKRRLHREINRDNADECRGCPFITFDKWGEPLSEGVKYLSFEYHSVCNMRCVYCSETYYGGKKPRYDITGLVTSLTTNGALDGCEYVVWGGGEPVIDKHFEPLLEQTAARAKVLRQRVITNATRFSPVLARLMAEDRAFIVTSIDAGTSDVFTAVRGYPRFDKVLKTLARYADAAAHNIIIKYIVLPQNRDTSELDAFAELIISYGLRDCNYQISCDFKTERIDAEELIGIASLYARLHAIGTRFQFLDDLVWQRLPGLDQSEFDPYSVLAKAGLEQCLARCDPNEPIIVWGTGAQASMMLHKSRFLCQAVIECFIDPRPSRAGTSIFGRPVYTPEYIKNSEARIVIAAVQSAPFIFRDALALGVQPERIVTDLIL